MWNDTLTIGFAFFQMQRAALRMAGASSFVEMEQTTRFFAPARQDTDLQKIKSPVNQQVQIQIKIFKLGRYMLQIYIWTISILASLHNY